MNLDESDAREIGRSFLPVGTLLRGKYRIDQVIGTGGMAVVYAATHRNRKRFAVKMLHPHLSTRAEIRSRFIREGYVANSVEHPGVVSVLDDDVTEDGAAFLVMELLEGSTIEGFNPRTRPLPLRESLAIAIDVLDVLEAAHGKNIVHRDIKPANLFVTREGQVKVLDFGIARLRDATLAANTTATGATLGTPAFMAPEQALGMASEVDARTDLWALGATLFTMLSGSLVHEGGSARQVLIRAATQPARSLSSVAPDVPTAVSEWVSKALLFDKQARWESAAVMRAAALKIQHDLFGASEQGCAKRLFEQCAVDIGHSPTVLSPTSELSSAVREMNRPTLSSQPDRPETSPSIPALRLDGPAAAHLRTRRPRLALIAVATITLGTGASIGDRPSHPPARGIALGGESSSGHDSHSCQRELDASRDGAERQFAACLSARAGLRTRLHGPRCLESARRNGQAKPCASAVTASASPSFAHCFHAGERLATVAAANDGSVEAKSVAARHSVRLHAPHLPTLLVLCGSREQRAQLAILGVRRGSGRPTRGSCCRGCRPRRCP